MDRTTAWKEANRTADLAHKRAWRERDRRRRNLVREVLAEEKSTGGATA